LRKRQLRMQQVLHLSALSTTCNCAPQSNSHSNNDTYVDVYWLLLDAGARARECCGKALSGDRQPQDRADQTREGEPEGSSHDGSGRWLLRQAELCIGAPWHSTRIGIRNHRAAAGDCAAARRKTRVFGIEG